MKSAVKELILISVLGGFVACSKVEFSSTPTNGSVGSTCTSNCSGVGQNGSYNYSYTTGASQTDLLFVVDNSASMFSLQQQMGNKFPTLFNFVKNLDYHIGIINTDVVTADDPSNPARTMIDGLPYKQNGNLISFPDTSSFLTDTSSNPQSQFLDTIQRQETLLCQNWIQNNCDRTFGCSDADIPALDQACPSEQTRAIWSSIMAIQNNSSGFFRDSSVPLNIVILSNSDERASGGTVAKYPLETNDLPSTLISTVQQTFPGKQLKVHSIIIVPGDSSCLLQQGSSSQPLPYNEFGFYGNIYSELSNATSGVVGSICSSDYSPLLTQIATSIGTDNGDRNLPCMPATGSLQVVLSPNISDPYSVTTTSSGTPYLQFSSPLPSGTTVQLTFQCQQ